MAYSLMIPWLHITSFGDTVVMLPAAAAIVAWLIAGRACRTAVWWCLLFTFGLALVAATKIAFVGWGIGISALDFTGISGHAMRATAVFPVIFYLALRKSPPLARASGVLLGVMIGVLIGMSRVVLHTHSVSEVVAGCALGGAIALGFIRISNQLPKPFLNPRIIALSLLALLPTSYAEPAPTNQWINAVALYLSGHDTPYVRIAGKVTRPGCGGHFTGS
jgi:membrane-associated phospholipid phosphatase